MQVEKITEIKKELVSLSAKQLTDICLRLAKYKKENKELLNYLLYDAHAPLQYCEKVKSSLEEEFRNLSKHYYQSTKQLRKILRTLNKHAKYTANKQVETELLLWFCRNFLEFANTSSSHKPLQGLLIRQLQKIATLTGKLHEDLQFDYERELLQLLDLASKKIRGFNKKDIVL